MQDNSCIYFFVEWFIFLFLQKNENEQSPTFI